MRCYQKLSQLLALALCVTIVGCGFAPEDDFTGTRVGDGIAPWAEIGAVQICLGTVFIGPPDDPAGGLCTSNTLVQEPCLADNDCGSRESCVCGRCIVQYCRVNSDCGNGRTCSFSENRCDVPCAVDEDCGDDSSCFNSTCRGRCEVDTDCQAGEVCNSLNRCITADCSNDGECLAGELCRIQRVPRVATEPTILAGRSIDEPRYTMWLEVSEELAQDRRAIWRATSHDGVHYRLNPASPVLIDADTAHAPSVVRAPDGGYDVYYEFGDGAELRYSQSTDGINFGTGSPVLTGTAGTANAVRSPSAVLMPDGQVAVYYQIGDGTGIGLATGSLGGSLTSMGPVLTPSDVHDPPDSSAAPQFWIDISNLRSPYALTTESATGEMSLRLWFSAFGRESGDSFQFGDVIPIEPTYSLGYASADISSPSTLSVWPFNPIFDRVNAFLDHRSELTPAVVRVRNTDGSLRDGYLMYYLDADATNTTDPPILNRIGVSGNGAF